MESPSESRGAVKTLRALAPQVGQGSVAFTWLIGIWTVVTPWSRQVKSYVAISQPLRRPITQLGYSQMGLIGP